MININATLVVQLINFLVLIWILNKLLFKPIFKIMEEREKTIEDSKSEMKRLKVEAQHKTKTLEANLREARQTAGRHREEIRGQANLQAEEIIGQAQTQAKEHISLVQGETQSRAELVRQSLGDYKNAVVELVLLKIMGRKV